jgi:hypothetical protein
MSAIWEVWKANGRWYALRWADASPDYGGPFEMKEAALAFAQDRCERCEAANCPDSVADCHAAGDCVQ